jgi:hypothetical protein
MSESSDGPPAGERIGLRVSEACDLRWDDIDLGRRTIIVRRLKGSTDSSHYLERDELAGLKALQRDYTKRGIKFAYVFLKHATQDFTHRTGASVKAPWGMAQTERCPGGRGGGWTAGGGDAVGRRNAFSVRAALIFGCRQCEKAVCGECR